jgi:hypothetical protein
MAGCAIGETAGRSDFAAALRCYERIDVVRPAARSAAGYRDGTVDDRGVALEVDPPDAAAGTVTAVFGGPTE